MSTTMTDEEIEKLCAEATQSPQWGETKVKTEAEVLDWFLSAYRGGPEGPMWTVWVPDPERPGECLFAAVTGNGPRSRANARLYAYAPTLVPALLERARRAERHVTYLLGVRDTLRNALDARVLQVTEARAALDSSRDDSYAVGEPETLGARVEFEEKARETLKHAVSCEVSQAAADRIRLLEQERDALAEREAIHARENESMAHATKLAVEGFQSHSDYIAEAYKATDGYGFPVVCGLPQRIELLRQDAEHAFAQVRERNERVRLLEQEVAALTDDRARWQAASGAANLRIDELEAEVAALNAKLTDVWREVESEPGVASNTPHATAVRIAIGNALEHGRRLSLDVDSLTAEVAALKEDLRDASEHVARLQAEALKIEAERDRLAARVEVLERNEPGEAVSERELVDLERVLSTPPAESSLRIAALVRVAAAAPRLIDAIRQCRVRREYFVRMRDKERVREVSAREEAEAERDRLAASNAQLRDVIRGVLCAPITKAGGCDGTCADGRCPFTRARAALEGK